MLTTFTSYGTVSSHRQAEILGEMMTGPEPSEKALDADTIRQVTNLLSAGEA